MLWRRTKSENRGFSAFLAATYSDGLGIIRYGTHTLMFKPRAVSQISGVKNSTVDIIFRVCSHLSKQFSSRVICFKLLIADTIARVGSLRGGRKHSSHPLIFPLPSLLLLT
ncbi:hypothetical protein M378DRAFT_334916 [Amanita muscaria Koide BX008]|uniref:Uncharacterized protein n=1 Tax=Amanita muscaria (strain Koide BX008) TaxID=946122 RepID=A0A0C2WPU0_AMAMK|nr:hypothetical protein M378DRAFT_334916 [Amanita muscaria Koide BX008]